MRVLIAVLGAAMVAGCVGETNVPQRGVGFETYAEYQRRREEELIAAERARRVTPAPTYQAPASVPAPAPAPAAAPAPAPVAVVLTPAPAVPAVVGQPLSAISTAPVAPTSVVPTAPAATEVAAPVNNTGISDEQDFAAVAARESIESDKARIEANREQYVQVDAAPLPQRSGSGGPSIVEYALAATNRVGQPVYKRGSIALSSHTRACAKYTSADLAQEGFLKRGGPKRDPMNLDPDGDGFACTWDPTPFQKARGG